jgi:multimeric flavodoxin WrbA
MKVVAVNGSPHENGNTRYLLDIVCGELEASEILTETIHIGGKQIRGCIACGKCFELKNRRCVISLDIVNDVIETMLNADGIFLGSPTYFADLTPELKALIDRAGMVAKANRNMFQRKAGAGVVAVRRAGAVHTLDSINHFFTVGQMFIVGSTYWNVGIGQGEGTVQDDNEGIQTMQNLGQNMAWLLKRIS